MAQTYTGNINLSIGAVDNVSGLTLFNHQVTNTSNPANVAAQFVGTASIGNISFVFQSAGCAGFYVKNISSTGTPTLTISWNNGSGVAQVITLITGQFLLIFSSFENILVSNITGVIAGGPASVEWAIWS